VADSFKKVLSLAMITKEEMQGMMASAMPSMIGYGKPRYDSRGSTLEDWKLRFACQIAILKKSGKHPHELKAGCQLMEQFFSRGDDDVKREARELLVSIYSEAHRSGLSAASFAGDWPLRTAAIWATFH